MRNAIFYNSYVSRKFGNDNTMSEAQSNYPKPWTTKEIQRQTAKIRIRETARC